MLNIEDKTKVKIKTIESLLYRYANTDNRIKAMEIEIEIIETEYCTLHGASENQIKPSTATNQVSSTIEELVIDKERRINKLKDKIRTEKINKRMIENAIDTLKEQDRKFIEDRYFKKLSPKVMAEMMYYCTESWVFIRSRKIIKEQLAMYFVN